MTNQASIAVSTVCRYAALDTCPIGSTSKNRQLSFKISLTSRRNQHAEGKSEVRRFAHASLVKEPPELREPDVSGMHERSRIISSLPLRRKPSSN